MLCMNTKGEDMINRQVEVVTTAGVTIAIILFLMSGFDAVPKLDNVLVFVGVSIFVIIAAIKKLWK